MENNDQKQIASAIVIAGLIIAGAILLKDKTPGTAVVRENTATNTSAKLRPVSNDDHIVGNKNAKIVIVEYSDTECPFCKVFHETMQKIVEQKKGEVAWVYRHYPLYQSNGGQPPLHPKALKEAEATECAWEQGGNTAFWKYVDRIFAITPSNNRLEYAELTNVAEYVGLNTSSFYTCLESGKYKDKVDNDIKDGAGAGVRGTPFSVILVNGKVVDTIPGAQPYDMVLQRLDALK